MKNIDIQEGGIVLHENWKLFPVDSHNWELCERCEVLDNARSRDAGTVGTMRWRRCGRYYSHNTIDCALLYVADNLMKAKCRDAALTLDAAVAEWKATIRELERTVVSKVGA